MLGIKLFSENAQVPRRQTDGAVGYDLHSAEDTIVPARGVAVVGTGVGVRLPEGTYGRVAPRSGLSVKGIAVGAGVVDRDWTGPVGVVLYNLTDAPFEVRIGHRIAQLILERAETPDVVVLQDLEDTERGAKGFGSTGV